MLVTVIVVAVLYREDLLKFMVKKHVGKPHLHFTLLRKLKRLEVCTNVAVSLIEIGNIVSILK